MKSAKIHSVDSRTITLLRLPLALCIIFIHLNLNARGSEICWTDLGTMDVYRIVVCVVKNELANLAVPLFFIISGYLFFVGVDSERYERRKDFFRSRFVRRIRSLLLPYVLFNLIALVGLVCKHYAVHHDLSLALDTYVLDFKWLRSFWDIHQTGTTTNILGIQRRVAYPLCTPLWFVRDLMVVVLYSPLIYFAIKKLRYYWFVIMLFFTLTGIWIPWPGFGVTVCLFFSIGAWFSINRLSVSQTLRRGRRWLLPTSLVLFVADILADSTSADKYIHVAFLLTGTLAIYLLFSGLAQRKNPKLPLLDTIVYKWGGQASFFIFATHTLVIPLWNMRPVEWALNIVWTNSQNGLLRTLEYFGAALLTFLLCYTLFAVLKILCPKAIDVLTGRNGR